MSDEPTEEQPVPSQSSGGNPAVPLVGGDAPPSPSQLVTTLGSTPPSPTTTGPGDSPPLPKVQVDLLNDGIADQVSRRQQRGPVVIAALSVLAVFTLSLSGIVGTLGTAFYQALKPENIATFAALELKEKIDKVTPEPTDKSSASSKSEKGAGSSNKASASKSADAAKGTDEHVTARENAPIKVEAKIYGEIRDSMVPLVALVSILTVAIVVILGTMLKAAFAPHPNNSSDLKEKEETSPVPLIEALKALVDSVKAAWK